MSAKNYVWVHEIESLDEGLPASEKKIFQSEIEACKFCCSIILERINCADSSFSYKISSHKNYDIINSLIRLGNLAPNVGFKSHLYRSAIETYNNCLNDGEDDFIEYFSIMKHEIDYNIQPNPVVSNYHDVSINANVAESTIPFLYKASEPGANCRKCGSHSEYAYADQENGTYHCRSCKMMNDVFGS